MRLRDDMQEILDRLARGVRLIGPVRVPNGSHWGGSRQMPWGFADGRRARKISVDALAARGLIRIEEHNGRRRAELKVMTSIEEGQ